MVFFQDLKYRAVTWYVFPLLTFLVGYLFFNQVSTYDFFYTSVLYNELIVFSIMMVLFLYSKFKLKLNFFKEAFGLGDALFFILFAAAFPTVTFVILFVFSLLFSLVITVFYSKFRGQGTVPLAGLMSFFLLVTYVASWLSGSVNLYVF